MSSITQSFPLDWLGSVGSRFLFELDPKNPILYVLQIKNILGKLPVVPVGDTGTIPFLSRIPCDGAYRDRTNGDEDGCTCGMSTRGLWDGPVTCNGGRCHMKPCFQTFCFIIVISLSNLINLINLIKW